MGNDVILVMYCLIGAVIIAAITFVIGLKLGKRSVIKKMNTLVERNAKMEKRLNERRKTIEINNLDFMCRDLDFPNSRKGS